MTAHRRMCGMGMARSGAQKDRESGYRASLLGNWTEVVLQATHALLLTRYLHATPSLACWANERASDHMAMGHHKPTGDR